MRKFTSFTVIGALLVALYFPSLVRAAAPVTFVRRSEAAMILLKNSGVQIDLTQQSDGAYPDMLDGEWYVPYMLEAMHRNILRADPATGLAYPHRSVTRADFLQMMTKAFNLTTNIPYQFTDVHSSDPVAAYAGLAWRYKILRSTENPNYLQPKMRLTHAEAAQAILKLFAAEPSLQPHSNFIPQGIAIETRDARQTLFSEVPATTTTASPALSGVSPKTIKSAILSLIRPREHLAEQTRNALIDAVNAERAKYKLAPLKSNYYLELSAQRHARDMAERGYFSHFTPEGLSYVDRIRQSGYVRTNPNACSCAQQFDLGGSIADRGPDYVLTGTQECSCEPLFSLGENLAKGQLSVEQVMKDWMNSPHHRENMLRPEFEEIGIGLFGDVWAQNFGRLRFE